MKKKTTVLMFLLAVLALFCVVPQTQAAVKLSKTKLTLTVGKKATLKVTGTKKKVKWSSSKKKVAAVSSKGVVTAKKAGTAKITAKVGGKKYTCKVTVTKKASAASKVSYTTYKHSYFTASIPKGWKVQTGLMGQYDMPEDILSYGIRIYDPANTDRCLYYCLNTIGVKSQQAHNVHVNYYRYAPTAEFYALTKLPVIGTNSTAGFFQAMQSYYGMKNFAVTKNAGKGASGGDVLRATATSTATGKAIEGMFTAYSTASSNVVWDSFAGGMVDMGYAMVFSIAMEKAPKSEFADWEPVLNHVLESIKLTDSFHDKRKKQWETILGTVAYQKSQGDMLSDMIMSAWDRMQ